MPRGRRDEIVAAVPRPKKQKTPSRRRELYDCEKGRIRGTFDDVELHERRKYPMSPARDREEESQEETLNTKIDLVTCSMLRLTNLPCVKHQLKHQQIRSVRTAAHEPKGRTAHAAEKEIWEVQQ